MSRHILVVEDEEDSRKILRDLLGNAGYELTEARTASRRWRQWQNSGLTSSSWTSNCRSWTATRPPDGSGPIPT